MSGRRKSRELPKEGTPEREALQRAGCDLRLLDQLLKSVQDAQPFTASKLRGGTSRDLNAKLAAIRKAAGDVRQLLRSFTGNMTVMALGASKLIEEAGGSPKRMQFFLERIQDPEVAGRLGLSWDPRSGQFIALNAKNYHSLPFLLESFAKEFESIAALCRPNSLSPRDVSLANLASYVAVFTAKPFDAEVSQILSGLDGWSKYSLAAYKMWKSRNKVLIRWLSSKWQDKLFRSDPDRNELYE